MGMGFIMCLANKQWQWLLFAIAAVFHIVGIVGIGILHQASILHATSFHLLLMGGLLFASYYNSLRRFLIWSLAIFILCFAAEWVGVHYGWLFGGYSYGGTLGSKLQGIPLLIGLNWLLVVAGAVSLTQHLRLPPWGIVIVSATFATGYDWLLEPLAVRLQYWSWHEGRVPAYNYLCWWGLSALSTALWLRLGLRGNLFAAGLFIIQIVFFILLRILL